MEKSSILRSMITPGRKYLLRFTEGDILTCKQAIVAKCCECMNGYIDGRADCRVSTCPLYQFMPYRENKPDKQKRAGNSDGLRKWRESKQLEQNQ